MRNLYFEYFENCDFSPTKPYKTVENLTVENNHNGYEPLPDYTKMFPGLPILKIKGYPFIFDGKFPNLTVFEANTISNNANFTHFFTNNPQIKTLSVCESRIEYLKAAQDLLPQLENFTFIIPENFRSYNGPNFIFLNVKILKIKDEFQTFVQSKLNLKSLEQFTIDMSDIQLIENEWIHFIDKHLKNITTTTRANGILKVSKAANYIQADIYVGTVFNIEDIMTFVKNNEKLQKFKFTFVYRTSKDEFSTFIVRLRGKLDEKSKLNQNYGDHQIELINIGNNGTNEKKRKYWD